MEKNTNQPLTGVYCYEAMPNGDLKLFVVPTEISDDPVEVIIEHDDLKRLHCAIGDAMMKTPSRR